LAAAVDLLGTEGVRSLTHARIDARADLPKGSTSNSFRTRAALLSGVVDWIVEREMVSVGAAGSPGSAEEFVESMAALVEFTTGPNQVMTAARLALFLEGGHNLELRSALARGRTAMEDATAAALHNLGAPDPATAALAVMACAEGLILHRIARGDETDPRPALALVLRGVLS
jgi:DNA-binding transcriptional regulator YbjK